MPDADCRLAIRRAYVLLRLQDVGADFVTICLWRWALGL